MSVPWGLILKIGAALALVAVVFLHFKHDADQETALLAARDRITVLTADLKRMTDARDRSERLRGVERSAAATDATEAQRACSARVEAARRSSRTIERIVRVPNVDPTTNCPLRGVVPTDELRNAITGAP